MAVPVRRHLSLPEEFVLLSHLPSGKVHGTARAAIGCAAAELGELALRRRLLIRTRKWRRFGFDVYRAHGIEIELLDTGPTGLVWADELLSQLQQRCSASGNGRFKLRRWFRHRDRAFSLHRDALAARGLLVPKSGWNTGLFGAKPRHHPHPQLRDALIAEIRAANGEHSRIDERMLFLRDIVETVGLGKELGAPMSTRAKLDRARGAGAVEFLPEDLRDTSAALVVPVPRRDNEVPMGRRRI
jgi:hypothetical protein